MIMQPNRLRRALAENGIAMGTAAFSWSPAVVDVAARAGFDFIRFDVEHSWRQDETLEQLVRAANAGYLTPLVRIDRDNPFLVRKVLEIGAGGVIIPDVRTVSDARALVSAARFPPLGERGYSSICQSANWGADAGAEWVKWSNREPMLGVMIEHIDAMDAVSDILAVEGVDFAFFGPADFSMSIGLGAPDLENARVRAAIVETIVAARDAGKHVALGVGNGKETIAAYAELGVTMLECGNDLGTLRAGWSRACENAALSRNNS